MANTDAQLVRTIRIFAVSIGAVVAILFPLGHWLLAHDFALAGMETQARIHADLVTKIVNANPRMWQYEEHRLQTSIDHNFSDSMLPEIRRIYDEQGHVLVHSKGVLDAPTVSLTREFFDAGHPAGWIEVEVSLLPKVYQTLGVAMMGLVLGAAVYWVLLVLPMRALRRALGTLRHEKERLRVVVDNAHDSIITVDGQLRIEAVNPAAEKMFGYAAAEMLHKSIDQLVPQLAPSGQSTDSSQCADQYHVEAIGRRNDGAVFPVEFDMIQAELEGNRKYILTVHDITARKRAAQRLATLANYDPLTGLPNRTLFRDRLQQAILRAQRNNKLLALMFLDLDRFKTVNDSLGHEEGDQLLQRVAERLQQTLRSSDVVSINANLLPASENNAITVSRLGGDEFTVIVEDLRLVEHVAVVAQKTLELFTQPFNVVNRSIYTSASIGITMYPFDDTSIDGLIKNADTAMYRAKESGRNTYQFFTAGMNARAGERLSLESSLRVALEHEQFRLYYQPKLDLVSNAIVGFEALLRWQHPEQGIVPPLEFIPLLEETGLIVPIGEWVIRQACRQAVAWQSICTHPIAMAVNISARQFKLPGLAETVAAILQETGLAPALLELEMTESMLMENTEGSVATLRQLENMGIKISIDDFGTGYSSLAYLKRFPIGVLKIDRSFVNEVTTDPEDAAIARAIIALAHSLKLNVVAEGVETAEQLAFLRANACDIAQGYFISRPMDAQSASQWLEGTASKQVWNG